MKKLLIVSLVLTTISAFGQTLKDSKGNILESYVTNASTTRTFTLNKIVEQEGSYGILGNESNSKKYYYQCGDERFSNIHLKPYGKAYFFYSEEACHAIMPEVLAHIKDGKSVTFTVIDEIPHSMDGAIKEVKLNP